MKVTTSRSNLTYGLLYDFGDHNLVPVASFGLAEWLLRFALSEYSFDDLSYGLYVYFYPSRKRIPFHRFLINYHNKYPDELEAISPGLFSKFEHWYVNEYLPF